MKVILADDHGLFRDSMSVWLTQLNEDISIDFADSLETLLTSVKAGNCYNFLMLDLGMPGMKGVLSVAQLHDEFPEIPIIVVSANEDPHVIRESFKAGAKGYVPKSSDGATIIKAAKQVLSGGEYIPPCLDQIEFKANQYNFNDRQLELLALLAQGHSNKKISEIMLLSEGTVKQYVTRIFDILNVDNRVQAGNKARHLLGISSH